MPASRLLQTNEQTSIDAVGRSVWCHEAHWLAEYLHELSTFPKSKFDDQVDSTSQALEWLKQRVPGWGILEYYRLAVEEMKMSATRMLILKVPAGTSSVHTIIGRSVMVRPDGTIEVNEEDARPLCGIGYVRL